MKTKLLFVLLIPFGAGVVAAQKKGGVIMEHGSTILTVISNDSIWIASDSKVSVRNSESRKNKYAKGCKVFNYQNIHYSVSGTTRLQDPDTKGILFDADKEVLDIIKKGKPFVETFADCYKTMEHRLFEVYKPIINSCSDEDIHYLFDYHPVLLSISMSMFSDKNKPMYIYWAYKLEHTAKEWSIQPTLVDTCIECTANQISLQGATDSINTYLNKNPLATISNIGMRERLIDLINMQIAKDPAEIGLPIVVKVIYAKGNKWLTAHKSCE